MAINIVWGPLSIAANTPTASPALTVTSTDTTAKATADLSAMPAGIAWTVLIHYRKSTTDPWIDYGSGSGTTLGGPDHDKFGNVIETGVTVSPLPDAGVTGRQLRVVLTLGAAATLSGHVVTT